jgi:ankyrin repeat protein
MNNNLFQLIRDKDFEQLKAVLSTNPRLANEGIPCNDNPNSKKGHPLHRICDFVFAKQITDEEAIQIATILLEFGANIDGYKSLGDNNTPILAAASLHAEKLGIFYIEQGADIFYADKSDGATPLHWAAFCGKDKLVQKLIEAGAHINQLDHSHNSTPLGWAIHSLDSKNSNNSFQQLDCIKILLKAGADKNLLNSKSIQILQTIGKDDRELAAALT